MLRALWTAVCDVSRYSENCPMPSFLPPGNLNSTQTPRSIITSPGSSMIGFVPAMKSSIER